ncbi:MAG: ABC-F family ATP-binding cassette domain-containing protein [Atopobiaceae bacterium]
MGILIGCEHLSQEWPGKRVLSDVTIGINEGERIGVVGKNGDGKSTLLSLIGREFEPDSGSITYRNGIHVGCLGQADHLDDAWSVTEAIFGDEPEYVWASDAKVRAILSELLGDIDLTSSVGTLSGGQRRRCDLARVLVGSWDVILMDEPTNHLDMHAITWLANHLKHRWQDGQGALLVVTHDRWFLDEVCEHMWEVHDGEIEPFEGGYSAYIQQRVERQRQAAVMEERRQNMLRKELNWLAHGAKARTSKPKFRIDAAMELLAGDQPVRDSLELKRMAVSRLGKKVIDLKHVSAGYPTADGGFSPVLNDISWIIGPGDRVGILGENGAGKSTLLRVMCGLQDPSSGIVKIGKSVHFGWLSQHLDGLSAKDDWRVQEILTSYKKYYVVDGKPQSPEQMLERLGFEHREFMTYVHDLSGGQKRRLAFLMVLLEEPNVLVLDEPGNDLDTDMLAIVEDLLDTWPGTLIMVSHDRYLMERVTDDQYALIDGTLTHVPGGIDEYLERLKAAGRAREAARQSAAGAGATSATHTQDSSSEGAESRSQESGLSNKERRELKKRYDAVERKLEKLEGEPEKLEDELQKVDPTNYEALVQAQAALDACRQEISSLESEWLELADTLGLA